MPTLVRPALSILTHWTSCRDNPSDRKLLTVHFESTHLEMPRTPTPEMSIQEFKHATTSAENDSYVDALDHLASVLSPECQQIVTEYPQPPPSTHPIALPDITYYETWSWAHCKYRYCNWFVVKTITKPNIKSRKCYKATQTFTFKNTTIDGCASGILELFCTCKLLLFLCVWIIHKLYPVHGVWFRWMEALVRE